MNYKRLGKSGLIVSDLSLGTMIFGEEGERGTSQEDATKIIHRFLDAGGNFIDTADVYVGGRSEEIVGEAIKDRRDEVILATKVRFPTGEGKNDVGLSRHHILNGVKESLRRLNTDRIDLLYVHCWDPFTPLEETLRALNTLIEHEHVRYIGVSNFKAWQLMKALSLSDAHGWSRFVAGQYQYSLVKRDIEHEFSDLALSEGVGLTPWGPLGGGFLSGKYKRNEKPENPSEGRIATTGDANEESWERRNTEQNWRILEVAEEVAQAHGSSVPQVALAWLRGREEVSSVILGVRTLAQLEDNLGAADLTLSDEERSKLDEVSALPELYPYRMIRDYGARTLD